VLVAAGDIVRAGWRIKNTGSCTWDTAYMIRYADVTNPGWDNQTLPARLPRSIRPGETYDARVEAVVPGVSGAQTAMWALVNGRGEQVGEPLTLAIETAALPTNDRRAMRWFEAYPISVQPGERAALSWSMQNAKAVYLSGPGVSNARTPLETTANRYVFPQRTTKYQLRVVNGDDSVDLYTVTVEVEDYLEPRIRVFELTIPESTPECVQIEWITENRVNRVVIFRDGLLIWDGVVDDGVIRDCPDPGRVVYVLQVFGPGGDDVATRSIEVDED